MPNTAQTARLARRRGYQWERSLADRINQWDGWTAFRLGSPSTKIPDILAVGPDQVIAIECKTGQGDLLYIPSDQISNCRKVVEPFSHRYETMVVGAFKFLGVNGKKTIEHGYRLKNVMDMEGVRCSRNGTILMQVDGEVHPMVRPLERFDLSHQ